MHCYLSLCSFTVICEGNGHLLTVYALSFENIAAGES